MSRLSEVIEFSSLELPHEGVIEAAELAPSDSSSLVTNVRTSRSTKGNGSTFLPWL